MALGTLRERRRPREDVSCSPGQAVRRDAEQRQRLGLMTGKRDWSSLPHQGSTNGHKYLQTVNTKRDKACLDLQGLARTEGKEPRVGRKPEPGILCNDCSRPWEKLWETQGPSRKPHRAKSWTPPQIKILD